MASMRGRAITSQGEREPAAEMVGPRRLARDVAPKYEKRGFNPRLSIIHDAKEEEEEKEKKGREDDDDDDGDDDHHHHHHHHRDELECPDDAHTIPGVPADFLPPSPPARRYTFLESLSNLSAEIDTFAEQLPATVGQHRPDDTKATAADAEPVRAGTARRLASSLRRHVTMRTVREKFAKTAATLGRSFRLPGRGDAAEAEDEESASSTYRAPRGVKLAGEEWEGSLARRLLGRDKKPKRPKVPEGWLFGPPPE